MSDAKDLPDLLRSTAAFLEQMDAETCKVRAPWLDAAANEIERLRAALEAEREACAQIADDTQAWCRSFGPEGTAAEIAKQIRARKGNQA